MSTSTKAQQQAMLDFMKEQPRGTRVVGQVLVLSSKGGTKEMLTFTIEEKENGKPKVRTCVLFVNKEKE